ncbi:hypothetical protein [Halobacterium wangiae]|uniref:hypothetical protein n=1 Tax=Halobacterium wangiae TaxID=2902623 RepID=UPI001E589783|nr:hypothetical protein [Halobacterium wangiae]
MSVRRLRDPSARTNALLGWGLLGVVLLAAVESFVFGTLLWGGFAVVFVFVAALPTLSTRDWTVLVPWPVLFVGAAAMAARAVGIHQEITAYTAVASLALVGVAELDTYTDVEMSRRFAVAFAALTTMAVQGLWTVVQYYSDQWLGTQYVQSQADIQWDFVFVTVVAVVVGGAFELYFKRAEEAGTAEEPTVE